MKAVKIIGVRRTDRISKEKVRKLFGVRKVDEIINKSTMKWYAHMKKWIIMDGWRVFGSEITGVWRVGRPRKR